MRKRPIAVDLFAGCGGMSLGLEAAGFDIAAAVEYDAIHSLVHHYNFPYCATLCRDLSHVKGSEILAILQEKWHGSEIDLIAGGPPCQGFSHIGKRQLDDPRNALVFEYLRLIAELMPKYFIFENVPGIATGEHRQFLEELISEFEAIGYAIIKPIHILDASDFGAPQKRKRLILVGSRTGERRAEYPIPSHSEMPNDAHDVFGNRLEAFSTVRDAIADLSDIEVFTNHDSGISPDKLNYDGYRVQYAPEPSGAFSKCHIRMANNLVFGHLGSVHTEDSIERFALTKPGTVEPKSRFFKLSETGLCNTLRAGTNSDKGAYTAPRPIHYSQPRCISVREAARLHTFPDWFQPHRTIWHGFREIGNAVVPLLAKALGDSIISAMEIDIQALETRILPSVPNKLLSYNMSQASAYWGIADDVIPKRRRMA